MTDLRHPIGRFAEDPDVTPEKRQRGLPRRRAMAAAEFARTFRRPGTQAVTLGRALQAPARHGRPRAAHIGSLRRRMHGK